MSEEPVTSGEPLSDRELVTSRLIDAPRQRVFKAFSDPAHHALWWDPKGFSNTFNQFDLCPGGAWRFVMHRPDRSNYPDESVFIEVAPPERVDFRHVSGPQFAMTITFVAQGAKTVVGWRQLFNTAAERQRIAEFAVEANEQNLDRLARQIAMVT